ncbi:hypothetical protein RHGRI_021010 [Rhododendron griersonianum]|uniref:Peptidase metallopeptidase domain-containing protein n=1 Tax=Rhododendron griersonianum TaxID=479676 RepID=A0AAV6JNU2_9ERIC|nr:hypothetical protein RHGRI_021010 [Rhododendron griersonianum]
MTGSSPSLVRVLQLFCEMFLFNFFSPHFNLLPSKLHLLTNLLSPPPLRLPSIPNRLKALSLPRPSLPPPFSCVVQLQPLEVARIGRVVAAIAIIGARPPTKYQLTYAFSPGTNSDAKSAVARAFSTWASNTQFTFSESPNHEIADLKIGFYRGDHGDGAPFNGANGILAHAFAPTDGRFHFNEDHSFSMEPIAGLFHLETVALHEIGHLLGLAHSQVQDTIMFPGIAAGTTKGLNADDIQGLKTLYDLEA